MIGIIVAMESEFCPYFEQMTDCQTINIGKKIFYQGKIGGKHVVLVLSGIGKVNASYTATLMLNNFDISFVISTGVSGGLGVTNVMTIVVAKSVVQHDCDSTALGDPRGFVNVVNKVFLDTDKALSQKFVKKLDAQYGVVACGDQFVAEKGLAEKIVGYFDAIACDMESGAIGQIAEIEQVPFVILRCISDGADEQAAVTFVDVVRFASEKLASAVVEVITQL